MVTDVNRPTAPRYVDDRELEPDSQTYDTRLNTSVAELAQGLPTEQANYATEISLDKTRLEVRTVDLINETLIKGTPLDQLYDKLASFRDNPVGFVHWAFPWGQAGTELEKMTGPEQWQVDLLSRVGDAIRDGGEAGCMLEEDVASGHGVGKSACVSWLILWAISTAADTRGIVTANTEEQLRKKTWAELATWYGRFIAKELFTLTATAIFIAKDKDREKKWRIDQSSWSKENTEAFAGLHNQGKRLLLIFDEASAIDDKVWTVARGALTDANTEIIWCRFGNPTRTSGEFFNENQKMPRPGHNISRVDSRTVSFTNKAIIAQWVEEYGEDSDFVRVRVKGMFPRAGYDNFIAPGTVTDARRRRVDPLVYSSNQKILAVDPARFGDDMSVITLRQGLRVHYQVSLAGFDGFELANRIAEIMRKEGGVSCIVYDAVGNGADLDTTLRRMQGLPTLIPVQWGQPAKNSNDYFNQRSEAWGTMKGWLEHGQIPNDDELATQLTSLSYGYDARFRIQLEGKRDAKKRGIKSPDKADSLALSYLPELIDRRVVTAKVRPVTKRRVIWTR